LQKKTLVGRIGSSGYQYCIDQNGLGNQQERLMVTWNIVEAADALRLVEVTRTLSLVTRHNRPSWESKMASFFIHAAKGCRIIWPMRVQGDGWYLVLTSRSLMKPEVEDYGLELPTQKPIRVLKLRVGSPNMKANWTVEDYGLGLPKWKRRIGVLEITGWNSQHEIWLDSWRLWVGTPNMKAHWSIEDYGLELPTWNPIGALKITGWNSQHEIQ